MRVVSRRLITFFCWIVGGLLALSLLLGGLLAWRLSHGPLPLGILTPYLEEALTTALAGQRTEVQETALVWDREAHHLELRTRQVTIWNQTEAVLATIPAVDVRLSLQALLHGTVALTAVRIAGGHLRLSRDPSGAFHVGGGQQPAVSHHDTVTDVPRVEKAAFAQVFPMLVRALTVPPESSQALTHLREVQMVRGTLTVQDQYLNETWEAPQTNLVLRRQNGGLSGHVQVAPVIQHTRVPLDITLAYSPSTALLTFDISFANVQPPVLAAVVPALDALAGVDLPLSGSFAFALDLHGKLHDLTFNITSGPGRLLLPEVLPTPRPIAAMQAQGRLDGATNILHLRHAAVRFGTAKNAGPLLSLRGTATGFSGDDMTITGRVQLTSLALADLSTYWPVGAVPKARVWLEQNLVAGMVDKVTTHIDMTLPGGALNAAKVTRLDGTLRYHDAEVHYLRPLPPVTGIAGSATFDRQGFRIRITSGQTSQQTITTGTVDITGLDRGRDAIAIRVGLAGSLRDKLALLNHPRLNLLSGLGIDPASTSGQATVQTTFAFSLRGRVGIKDMNITAHGTMQEVALHKVFLGNDVTHGNLQLTLDKQGMILQGTANAADIPLKIVWTEAFSRQKPWRSQVRLEVPRVDHADRQRLGIDLSGYVEGPFAADAQIQISWQGTGVVHTTMDLQDTILALPFLGWRKTAPETGALQATIQLEGGRPTALSTFALQAGTLIAHGTAQFPEAHGGSVRMALTQLHLGRSNVRDVVIAYRDKDYDITIGEGVLDVEPLMQSFANGAKPNKRRRPEQVVEPSPVTIQVRAPALRRVSFGPDRYLQHVAVHLKRTQHTWALLDLTGQIPAAFVLPQSTTASPTDDTQPKPRTFALRYRPSSKNVYKLSANVKDIGGMLRALNISDKVTGGRVKIKGKTIGPKPDDPIRATITAKQFTVQDAPALARILAAASFGGLQQLLDGDGLTFTRLTGECTLAGPLLTIAELHTHGGALGLTVEGTIDVATNHLQLKGTVIPLQGVNTLLGKIPLVNLLVGGKNQGLVAVNYRLQGPMGDPEVTVNPAAALTPGFLRRVFDLFEDGGEAQPKQPQR